MSNRSNKQSIHTVSSFCLSYLLVYDFREVFDRGGPVVVDPAVIFWIFQVQNTQRSYKGRIPSEYVNLNGHIAYTVSCRTQTVESKYNLI